ncbi:putative N-acetyltransferase YhbS [Arthrobacter sp. CAN_A214]
MHRGSDILRATGASGYALIGDPSIYGRSGFTSGTLTYKRGHKSLVQHVVLDGAATTQGELVFLPAFDDA